MKTYLPKSILLPSTMGRTSRTSGAKTAGATSSNRRTAKKRESNVKKSKTSTPATPPVPDTELETQPLLDDPHYQYKAFIVFVNDPKLKTPFSVLQSSNIQCLQKKKYVNDRYLNDNRRKRQYDVAFTNLFTFPCRVFAKALNTVTPIVLHNKVNELNGQFKVLMACKVDVETAYARLLESNPRKVTDGLLYETGDGDENTLRRPDTEQSFSDVDVSGKGNKTLAGDGDTAPDVGADHEDTTSNGNAGNDDTTSNIGADNMGNGDAGHITKSNVGADHEDKTSNGNAEDSGHDGASSKSEVRI